MFLEALFVIESGHTDIFRTFQWLIQSQNILQYIIATHVSPASLWQLKICPNDPFV